jgi:hypothetical protein
MCDSENVVQKPTELNIVTCRGLWILDRMIGFIDTLHTTLGATDNYNLVTDLNNFTAHPYARTRGFSLY